MYKEEGLAILARQFPLTDDDWFLLTSYRCQLISSCLHFMTLETVGDLKMIHDYFHTHDLKRDQPQVEGDEEFGLTTRGIFPPDDSWAEVSANIEHHRDSFGYAAATTEKLWGLTRNGKWITIEVFITRSRVPYKTPGRTEEVARAEKVIIRKASLREVSAFSKRSLEYLWRRLGRVIKDWAEERELLYNDASELREVVLREEAVAEIVLKR